MQRQGIHCGLARLYRRLQNSVVKGRYTPVTMAEYLRTLGAEVGEGCFIGPTDIELEINPRHLKIGNHVAMASGVTFATQDGTPWLFQDRIPDIPADDKVIIEDNCFIGYRAILYPGIRIGPNSVVGAGSVVVSDVPPNTLVMGVPARPFGAIEKYREKCVERWKRQRPPGVTIETAETWWSSRHLTANRELLRKHLLTLFQQELA